MGKTGRKTEKTPLTRIELARLEAEAQKHDDGWIIRLLRYTGAHPSALIEPKYGFHEERDEEGDTLIIWNRPKKKGKEAHTRILKSSKIADIDINKRIKQFQSRRSRRSRQYIYTIVKEVGLNAGIPNISPMTLRHSACVDLISMGVQDSEVRQILNVSERTLKVYSKYTTATMKQTLKSKGW